MRRFLLAAVMALAGCRPTLDFTLPDLDGNEVTPLRQGDAVVVAFWATWCGPCRKELEEMNEMYARLHPRGLELYAVSVDGPDAIDEVETWATEHAYAFPVLLDGGRLFRNYSYSGSIPYLLVFDAEGQLIQERTGYHPDGVMALEAYLDARLPPE